jgi:hypothetical protein
MNSRAGLIVLLLIGIIVAVAPPPAVAAPAEPSAIKKAAKHFQRGVALYGEADYRAALVEFRRAYEVAPNPAVLYNIGQAYYQVQNYAAALTTFERYLAEAGDGASHRAEVEQTLETLKARVGTVEISTSVPGCEVTVDDELVGTSPFAEPLLVSIGRRRIVAMCEGHSAESRVVEVAAGDVAKVALVIAALPGSALSAATSAAAPRPAQDNAAFWRKAGWTTTGVLAGGTLVVGVLAVKASRDLSAERGTFPTSASKLRDKASTLKTLSLAADILGALTVVVGGATLTYTLTHSSAREVRLSVAPHGLRLSGTF